MAGLLAIPGGVKFRLWQGLAGIGSVGRYLASVINAAAALYAGDRASSYSEAGALAMESIDSGAAAAKLEALATLSQKLE